MGPIQIMRFINLVTGDASIDTCSIERMGLLAVKLGQLLALRSDFLPAERCQELQRLYQTATKVPAESAQRLLEQNAPRVLLDSLASFEPEPVATASVGQVHRGRLRSGEAVAIKLLKDQFAPRFQRDIRRLKFQMRLARALYPPLRRLGDVTGLIRHLESYTLCELDLQNEIRGARKLQAMRRRMEADLGVTNWRVPRYHENLSNSDVLVSEWCEGPTLETLLSRGEIGIESLLQLFCIHGTCMFGYGEFHGDLHPGNVVLQDSEFIFLDNAAVVSAPASIRHALFEFFRHLSQGSDEAAFEALLGMAPSVPPAATKDHYLQSMRELYRDFRGNAVSATSMSRQMMMTIRKAVEAGCVFDEAAFPIIRSLMFMDGMVLRAAPETDIIGSMKPALEEISTIAGEGANGRSRQFEIAV